MPLAHGRHVVTSPAAFSSQTTESAEPVLAKRSKMRRTMAAWRSTTQCASCYSARRVRPLLGARGMINPATSLAAIGGSVWRSLRLTCRRLVPVLVLILGLVCLAASPGSGREIQSYAIVRDDGSLRIQGRNLRLFGIFIPDTGRVCGKTLPSCGSRAAIALDALLEGRGFVRCTLMGAGTAICYVPFIGQPGGRDLATHLLAKGLAVATPEAPPEYHAVEHWAQLCRIGIWGRFRPNETAQSWTEPCHLGE